MEKTQTSRRKIRLALNNCPILLHLLQENNKVCSFVKHAYKRRRTKDDINQLLAKDNTNIIAVAFDWDGSKERWFFWNSMHITYIKRINN